jgi:hypothetical protein
MKKLINSIVEQIKKNDSITNFGLVFFFGFILPTLTAVTIDIINNGVKMI